MDSPVDVRVDIPTISLDHRLSIFLRCGYAREISSKDEIDTMAEDAFEHWFDEDDERLIGLMGQAQSMLVRTAALEAEVRFRLVMALAVGMVALFVLIAVIALGISTAERLIWPLSVAGVIACVMCVAAVTAWLDARLSLPPIRTLERRLENSLMSAKRALSELS